MSCYLSNFKGIADIEKEYVCTIPSDAVILLAWYGYGSYEGDSFVLYEQKGRLYEVNGGHCSCNGLEGQWEPEETSLVALKKRKFSNYYDGFEEAQNEFDRVIRELEELYNYATSKKAN